MGGTIGMASGESAGSRFWFTAGFDKRTAGVVSPKDTLSSMNGLHVLFADSDESNRLLLASLLSGWGCRFDAAGDCESVLDLLERAAYGNDRYDAALLDRHMPKLDGDFEVRLLELHRESPGTKFIMMSSGKNDDEDDLPYNFGFSGYLAKPLAQTELYQSLVPESRKRACRILVADGNTADRRDLLKKLVNAGCLADVAVTEDGMLHSLVDNSYDLVFLDCRTPALHGFEAVAKIRKNRVNGHLLPIIAMMSDTQGNDREKCRAAGMDDYLGKPVDPAELTALLEIWLPYDGANRIRCGFPDMDESAADLEECTGAGG